MPEPTADCTDRRIKQIGPLNTLNDAKFGGTRAACHAIALRRRVVSQTFGQSERNATTNLPIVLQFVDHLSFLRPSSLDLRHLPHRDVFSICGLRTPFGRDQLFWKTWLHAVI